MWRKLKKWIAYAGASVTARRHARALLRARPIRRVLVLCYGNIYRSPFVAARLRADRRLEIRSAGFHPREERLCEPEFVTIAREFGVDLRSHRSRQVRQDDVDWADLVLIMDGHNYRLMHVHHPQALARTCWLGAAAPDTPLFIRDPYKLPQHQQQEIAAQLDHACAALLERLNSRATVS